MKKTIFRMLVSASTAITLAGCAATYTYEGQKYTSKKAFHKAVDASFTSALNAITPLSAPLTTRSLIVALPSEASLHAENIRRFKETEGREPIGVSKEIIDNLTISSYKSLKVFYYGVQKRNIYSQVQYVDLDSMNSSLEPSSTTDVLYYVEPARNSGQWFFATAKHGKQIFSYDRTRQGPVGKLNGFNEALQVMAVRE